MQDIHDQEMPYQVLSVVLALELLTLAALSPRVSGLEPLGFHAISSLRLLGLMVLGSLLHDSLPRYALPMLGLWGIILAPPELWAFSLEAREGLPLSFASSLLAGVGAYAFGRMLPSASQLFPLFGVMTLFFNGFQASVYSVPLLILLGSSMLCLVVLGFRKPALGELL